MKTTPDSLAAPSSERTTAAAGDGLRRAADRAFLRAGRGRRGRAQQPHHRRLHRHRPPMRPTPTFPASCANRTRSAWRCATWIRGAWKTRARSSRTPTPSASPSGTFKGCATFRDWRELLARKDIDAVMISTPDHWHVPMAIAALRAGKDVACEKPLTRNIAEGRLLSDVVTKTKRVFRTDSEFRSNRTMHRAAQLVRNGKIGKLQRIITDDAQGSDAAGRSPTCRCRRNWITRCGRARAVRRPYTVQRVHPRHDAKGRPGWLCISDYADGMMANWGAHLNDIALWGADLDHTGPVDDRRHGQVPAQGQSLGHHLGVRRDLHLRQRRDAPVQDAKARSSAGKARKAGFR